VEFLFTFRADALDSAGGVACNSVHLGASTVGHAHDCIRDAIGFLLIHVSRLVHRQFGLEHSSGQQALHRLVA
jgi:hypothetical protein